MTKQMHGVIPGAVLEGICKIIGDTEHGLTGREIEKYLREVNIHDVSPQITKWQRLFNAFANFQNVQKHSNNILKFISLVMHPSRFIGEKEKFDDVRMALNMRLSFVGLELSEAARYIRTEKISTISEAESRANRLKAKLELRNAHPRIFEYCKAELLSENYFHTVFEAVMSVAEIIRLKTGFSDDGAELIDRAFSIRNAVLKINNLQTETEQSEQKGFANLIKGVFGMFRNTTAHAPKIVWPISEDDALDILSTISLIHRKLDCC